MSRLEALLAAAESGALRDGELKELVTLVRAGIERAETCVVCRSTLHAERAMPHCHDCTPDEEHELLWESEVGMEPTRGVW